MENQVFELLAAGGDVATMAFLYVLWKFDRRILYIETKLEGTKSC